MTTGSDDAGTAIHAAFLWLASERRSWHEISDAWRANPAAPVFEDVARWTARGYARSIALFFAEQDDPDGPSLRQWVSGDDADTLASLRTRSHELARSIAAFEGEGPLAQGELFKALDALIDAGVELANRHFAERGLATIERPTRRFYPNGMMRRPWLAADWRPCLFPASADIERAGEIWPFLDYISEREHGAIVGAMDTLIERLNDRDQRTRRSPIRSLLEELELPDSDACVQLVKDQLFARGLDWRPDPPPLPPPVD